jgi:predicted AAA+ superfamily ATPase
MDAVRLRRVLSEQLTDSLRRPLPEHTPRRVFGRVSFAGKATAVTGIRRAGKTTFLHQMRRRHADQGIPRERLPYLLFEDERLAGLDAGHLGSVVDEYYRRFPQLRDAEAVVWCFDEIQMVAGWERFVRRLLDTERVEVFVTGSSAALLSREVATALRGRAWQVVVHPFSFEEALRHRGRPIPEEPAFLTRRERSHMERAMLDWVQEGGFPEAQGLDVPSRYQLLRDYVDVAVLRDVVERHGVRNVVGLRALVRHLLGNAGSLFSVEKFHAGLRSQGIAIGRDTLHQLLAHLEDCFLVRLVWMESGSERQRMVNPRKAYPVDPGLIPVFDRTGRVNVGHALETAVLVELERRGCEVTYVRTQEGYEVDFLARSPAGDAELIQICADASHEATAARELRALAAAEQRRPGARMRLLTLTRAGLPSGFPPEIEAQPVYEWFLGDAPAFAEPAARGWL